MAAEVARTGKLKDDGLSYGLGSSCYNTDEAVLGIEGLVWAIAKLGILILLLTSLPSDL